MHFQICCERAHLLFSSSILSAGTMVFPNSSRFLKDWKVLKCSGTSSKQLCNNEQEVQDLFNAGVGTPGPDFQTSVLL